MGVLLFQKYCMTNMGIIQRIHQLIATKKISCKELVSMTLQTISDNNASTNAFIDCFDERALSAAEYQDQSIAKGDPIQWGTGIPFGIKDNMCLEHAPVSCASAMLKGYQSPYTATAVARMMNHGFIPVGRTNMDEFAMGSSNEYSVYGDVSNPWNADRVPGGSSGGSAAAVAAGMVPVTLGSDTGGSIRQPASFCGVVGLKPTYGRVSRYGLVAFASSLDQIGPFAPSVSDAAYMLECMAGADDCDATSDSHEVPSFSTQLTVDSLRGKRIGVPRQLMSDAISPSVQSSMNAAFAQLESLGATVEMMDFPLIDEALATYYIIAPAEASSNLSRFDGVRYGHRNDQATQLHDMMQCSRQDGFGDEVKRRIILGTHVLSSGYYDAYYGKAQKVRGLIAEAYSSAFNTYDILCSPTAPTTAFRKQQHTDDPMQMYLSDIATIPVNLAGVPAISLPCGVDNDGLPIGLQMTSAWFDEITLLQVAHAFETVCAFQPQHSFEGVFHAV